MYECMYVYVHCDERNDFLLLLLISSKATTIQSSEPGMT